MINLGSAVGYLLLDTTSFSSGIKGALNQLSVFRQQGATATDKLTGLGAAFTGVGKTLTKNVTLPLAGLGTLAVNTATSFDSSMSKVSAISGAVGDDFDRLRDKAREMGAKTKFSASEAADAFTYMAMAGWKTEDMLDGIEGIMNLAAASGEDLASTSDIVTDALTAFGLAASDSAHFADVLAAASNSANTNVSMLGESFKYVAPVAGALGYSAEDTSIALGLMANSGIKASQAGTALRTILTNMADPTKDVASAMDILGVSLTDSEGNMKSLREIMEDLRTGFASLSEAEAAQVASMLAGKEGMSGLLAIVNASESDFNKLASAIDNADGTAESMANTMLDNLGGQLTILKSALEELAIAFGDILMPLIRDVVSWIQGLVDWLNGLSDEQKETIARILGVVAVVGPLLLILGKVVSIVTTVISTVKTVVTVIKGFKVAMMALNAVLVANPIGLIVAAIAALVAAFIHLWNNCEGFREFWINLWEGIKKVFSAVVDWIKQAIEDVATFFQELPDRIGEAIDSVVSWFEELPERIAYWLAFAVGKVVTWVEDTWNTVKEAIPNIISSIGTWFSELPDKIWKWLVETINKIIAWDKSIHQTAKEAISKFITSIVDGLKSLPGKFKEWFNKVLDFLKGLPKQMLQIGKDIFNGLWDGLKSIWNNIASWIDEVVNKIKRIFGAAKEGYSDATSSASSARGSYASGLDYVPRDMTVRVHEGEAILTKQENQNRSGAKSMFGNVSINISGAKYSDEQSLARAVASELQNLADRRAMVWE